MPARRRSPLGPGVCAACVGRGLLGAAAERLVADPSDPLAQVVLGVAARLARTRHRKLAIKPPEDPSGWSEPLPPWQQRKLAPRIAAAVGLLDELDRQEAEAKAMLDRLTDTIGQDRAIVEPGQLQGAHRHEEDV